MTSRRGKEREEYVIGEERGKFGIGEVGVAYRLSIAVDVRTQQPSLYENM